MPETKDRRFVGKRLAEATVQYAIALADPTAAGNTGLEGVDVDSEVRRFPNAGLARRWCEAFQPAIGEAIEARIVVQRWVENNYVEPGYGRIRDAEPITENEQVGELLTTGWSWSEPAPPTW